jgi:hypothetical protein
MIKQRLQPLLLDMLCVLALVVIGTRNHDTDTGLGGVLYVAAPFWIAVALAHGAPLTQKSGPKALPHKWMVVGYTIVMGMVLRNFVFDRGTALPFVIVATLFLGATMLGWRALAARRGAVS